MNPREYTDKMLDLFSEKPISNETLFYETLLYFDDSIIKQVYDRICALYYLKEGDDDNEK